MDEIIEDIMSNGSFDSDSGSKHSATENEGSPINRHSSVDPKNVRKRSSPTVSEDESGPNVLQHDQTDSSWEKIKEIISNAFSGLLTFVLRVVFVVLNMNLMVFGMFLIAIGVILLTKTGFLASLISAAERKYVQALQDFVFSDGKDLDLGGILKSGGIYVILIGLLNGLVALMGFMGGIRMSSDLLNTQTVASPLLMIEFIFVFYIYNDRSIGKDNLYLSLHDYHGTTGSDAVSRAWNLIMISLKCCGVEGYKDFQNKLYWPPEMINGQHYNLLTPVVCCKSLDKNVTCALVGNASPVNNNMYKGCYDILFERVFDHMVTKTVVVSGFLTQFVVLVLVSWLIWDGPDPQQSETQLQLITTSLDLVNRNQDEDKVQTDTSNIHTGISDVIAESSQNKDSGHEKETKNN